MPNFNTKHREGFPLGMTKVTEKNDPTKIAFSIIKLERGEDFHLHSPMECALLLLDGEMQLSLDGREYELSRKSLFEESPTAVHLPQNTPISIKAKSTIECALFETENSKDFPATVYLPNDTDNEHRGKGLVSETSLRYVRTIFDNTNSHPNAELVLGEVVNFPGRWSSYPPHHHPQPEIYHYRFTDPNGYGHGELGEEVFKVKQYDTLKILDNKDHSQCAAPGYGMYYIWVIRHLENNRYTVPEFTKEHSWTMEKGVKEWIPEEMTVLS